MKSENIDHFFFLNSRAISTAKSKFSQKSPSATSTSGLPTEPPGVEINLSFRIMITADYNLILKDTTPEAFRVPEEIYRNMTDQMNFKMH